MSELNTLIADVLHGPMWPDATWRDAAIRLARELKSLRDDMAVAIAHLDAKQARIQGLEQRWVKGTMVNGKVPAWVNLPRMEAIGVYGTPTAEGFGPPWCVKAFGSDAEGVPVVLSSGWNTEADAIMTMNEIVGK